MEDFDQVKQAYLHDSAALLTGMAAELASGASLHAACRTAHAIRGGAAAFGLDPLADAAHRLESVLALAGDGEIEASAEVVALLARGADLLLDMVQAADAGISLSPQHGADVLRALTLVADDEIMDTPTAKLGHNSPRQIGGCRPMTKAEQGGVRRFLTVAIEAETYGVDLCAVHKVARWTDVAADLPVIDLRALRGLAATQAGARHPVVIVDAADRRVALLVDAVPDILTVGPDDVDDEASGESWLSGWVTSGQRQTPLLALDRLCGPATSSFIGKSDGR
ncbi:MAG TPA: chemotaxis protein CheW [Patescibacteria group bacterium]|nr:chemotaxis protein CheW [Patescibacteria group bacterium]